MKLTRAQKAYVAIVGVAFVGLAIDRTLLAPRAASADAQTTTPVATPAPPVAGGAATAAEVLVPRRRLASRFRDLAEERGLDPMNVPDPFQVPGHWLPDRPEVVKAAPSITSADRFRQRHRLNAVMAGGARGWAIVDGRPLRLGETLDGFRLAAVRSRSIELEADGVTVELTLSESGGAGDRP